MLLSVTSKILFYLINLLVLSKIQLNETLNIAYGMFKLIAQKIA